MHKINRKIFMSPRRKKNILLLGENQKEKTVLMINKALQLYDKGASSILHLRARESGVILNQIKHDEKVPPRISFIKDKTKSISIEDEPVIFIYSYSEQELEDKDLLRIIFAKQKEDFKTLNTEKIGVIGYNIQSYLGRAHSPFIEDAILYGIEQGFMIDISVPQITVLENAKNPLFLKHFSSFNIKLELSR